MSWLYRDQAADKQIQCMTPFKYQYIVGEGTNTYTLSVYHPRFNTDPSYTISLPSKPLSLDWAIKSDLLAVGLQDRLMVLKVFDQSHEVVFQKEYNSEVKSVAFSYENNLLGMGSQDGSVQILNAGDFSVSQSLKCHDAEVTQLSFSINSKMIASSSIDRTCKIHSLEDYSLITTLVFSEHTNTQDFPFIGVQFSKCERLLFTLASGPFSYVTQWDLTNNFKPVSTHRIHSAEVTSFCIGVGTSDGWLKIINTRTMELEQDLEQFYDTKINAVCFSADGRLLCGGTERGGLAVVLNQHSEGFFSKASKVWVLFVFFLYFYLFFTGR